MAPVTLEFDGLAELSAALLRMPEECQAAATAIVREASVGMRDELQTTYPIGPPRRRYAGGNLRKGVQLEFYEARRGGATGVVSSRAKHAYLYDKGTTTRTLKGRGKYKAGVTRGAMPKTDLFVKTAIRYRRTMFSRLMEFCRSLGLVVTETAA